MTEWMPTCECLYTHTVTQRIIAWVRHSSPNSLTLHQFLLVNFKIHPKRGLFVLYFILLLGQVQGTTMRKMQFSMTTISMCSQGQNQYVSASCRRQKYVPHTHGHWLRVFPVPHQVCMRFWVLQNCIKGPPVTFFLKRRWAESAERHPHRFPFPHSFQSISELHFTLLFCISCSAFLILLLMVQRTSWVKWYTLHFIFHTGIKKKDFKLY